MANQKKVEHHAILALQAYFDDCDNVDSSFIAINDKRPALDGDIDVYQVVDQEQFSKRNLRFSMPVQVKGTTRQMLNNKFPVSIADLRYYEAHTQGLVYFVISEFKNERTIFYKKLAPIDVKDILAGKNGATESKNSTKSLKFKVLPKDPQVFLNILSDFHRQCSLQSKNVLDLSGVREPSDKIFLNVRSKQKFLEDTLMSGVYLYRQIVDTETGGVIPVPYASAELADVFSSEQIILKTPQGEQENATVTIAKYGHTRTLSFGTGDCIRFTTDISDNTKSRKCHVSFKPEGTLGQRFHDVHFLRHYLDWSTKDTNAGSNEQWDDFINSIREQDEHLEQLISDLREMDILPSFDPDRLTEVETKSLDRLLCVKNGSLIPSPTIQLISLKLENYQYCLLVNENRIINAFSPSMPNKIVAKATSQSGEEIPVNFYTSLHSHLADNPNFSEELVIGGFSGLESSLDSAADYYNLYVLDLLHAFDSSQRPIFLDTAKKILGMIENGLDSSVFMINTCQIERREQKNLSTYEVSQLLELAGNEDDTVKLSALILLD